MIRWGAYRTAQLWGEVIHKDYSTAHKGVEHGTHRSFCHALSWWLCGGWSPSFTRVCLRLCIYCTAFSSFGHTTTSQCGRCMSRGPTWLGFFAQVPGAVSRHQPIPLISGRATARLDLSGLDAAVRALFSVGLASLTQAAYYTVSRWFLLFCETYHVTQFFPVSKRVLSGFIIHLHEAGLAPGMVNTYHNLFIS